MRPEVVTHASADELAGAVAGRLVTQIVQAQADHGTASVVLTGGGVGTATLAAVAEASTRNSVDWQRLDVWWGDERFVPSGSSDRNETAARTALLDSVPVDAARVHPMAGPDGPDGDHADAAAARYAADLASSVRPSDQAPVPTFDVLLLGVGPDGHVASLFPELPGVYEDQRTAVAVHGAPKPPPTRISLTLPAINAAREVWLLVAGEEKAAAVAMALGGADSVQVPAAGVRGRQRTVWMLDQAAASGLPAR